MIEPEKPSVFFDSEAAEPELLVSLPSSPLSLPELWTYIQAGLEANNPELEALARRRLGRSNIFVDPIWQSRPGQFVAAIYELNDPDMYRSLTLETHFARAAIHLRVADVVEKHIKLDWEETASED
jgi:hypothetical protein